VVFIREGVYRDYAERFLRPEQIDAVDLETLPGYAHSASLPRTTRSAG